MIRPVESDYANPVAYSRALEYYCFQLEQQAEHLKTVMIAAAEEISKYWDAHCDEEGYGPVNLLRRLESGIPAQYGYSAGDFQRLRELVAHQPPEPPPECKTEAEKTAFAFGWFKSIEAQREKDDPIPISQKLRAAGYTRRPKGWEKEESTWVGLTEVELDKIIGTGPFTSLVKAVVSTVEGRLREKNK
jgi:hypothetical protein